MNIVNIHSENIEQYTSMCFCKKGSFGFNAKIDWMKKRLEEGLKIKFLIEGADNKPRGYIEYIDGENAWRSVEAKGYVFIHCIWISPNKFKNKGYASMLIKESIKDAEGKLGVAVMASNDSFMAAKDVFLKNGFKVIQEDGKQQLLVKSLKEGNLPKFKDHKKQLQKYTGWNIVYSNQCPWVSKFINDLDVEIIEKLNLKITELKNPQEAQDAPSLYGVFNLVKDGKILADHYISNTRFQNIINKHSG